MNLMAPSCRRKIRITLFTWLLFWSITLVNAQFSHCCDISKCKLVENTCRSAPLVNGVSCAETCLADRQFTCKPVDLDSLSTYNYSCFEPFIYNAPDQPLQKICGQTYSPGTAPAPPFYISHLECVTNCGGWALAQWRDPQAWATPLVQYILPAVIFSMTIPRRRRLVAPDSWFDFELSQWPKLLDALISLARAGLIVTLDTFVWICIIIATAGPMIVSGLHEAVLDWRVVASLSYQDEERRRDNLLYTSHRTQLQSAVVCGNLDLDVNTPQDVINGVMYMSEHQPEVQRVKSVHAVLSALTTSQYSFGQTVGAPVLFYLGSFLFNLATLAQKKGDNSTAHSLAFGMWWMVIVHAAIVAGCLLANNNPGPIAGVVAQSQQEDDNENGVIQHEPGLAKWWKLTTSYDTPFQSVTMWTRGSTKHKWIRRTNAWSESWFKRRIALSLKGWCFIGTGAAVLISIPSVLAGVVSWNTPRWGLGCRAMTFLVYACSQIVLIIITIVKTVSGVTGDHDGVTFEYALSTFYSREPWRRSWKVALVSGLLLIVAFAAVLTALFIGVAGTLMQVIGVYSNCWCAIPVPTWANPNNQMCNVASDTLKDRESSEYWKMTGYTAIAFMALTCYLGWWYQRYLRNRFLMGLKTPGKEFEVTEM